MNKNRVVIVARVSTDEQAETGTSIEEQLSNCRSKATREGWGVVAEYTDEGVSGAFLMSRPGMQAALQCIRSGAADILLTANLSRYSRDVEHQHAIRKAVRQAGGRVVFCDMDFDDTPEGDLAFTVMGGFAEYERKLILKRTYAGHKRHATNGVQTARSTPPFGYHIVNKADVIRGDYPAEMVGKYVIVKEQAEIVRGLFQSYVNEGKSLNELAKALNAAGVPTPGGGKYWRSSNIHDFFRNPTYKGEASFGKYEHWTDENRLSQLNSRTGKPLTSARAHKLADRSRWIVIPCPAVVDDELWGRANKLMEARKGIKGGNPQRVRMLAGKIYCPECGHACFCMSPTKQRSRRTGEEIVYPHRYVCGRYRGAVLSGLKECVPTGYYVHQVEEAVVEELLTLCRDERLIKLAMEAFQRVDDTRRAHPAEDVTHLSVQLERVKRQEEAAIEAQIVGIMAGVPASSYQPVLAKIASERADLEVRINGLCTGTGISEEEVTAARVYDASQVLREMTEVLTSPKVLGATKRDLLDEVIQAVYPVKGAKTEKDGARVEFTAGILVELSPLPQSARL